MSANRLELAERTVGEATVIDVIGELTLASASDRLLDKVRALVDANRKHLVINMSQCKRVDSAGLGELVTCLVTATRHDSKFRLANVPQPVRGLMKMTNMIKAFEVFDTEEEAAK